MLECLTGEIGGVNESSLGVWKELKYVSHLVGKEGPKRSVIMLASECAAECSEDATEPGDPATFCKGEDECVI